MAAIRASHSAVFVLFLAGCGQGMTEPARIPPPGSAAPIITAPPAPAASSAAPAPSPAPAVAAEPPAKPASAMTVYFVDVGQGDATVIVGPGEGADRKVMLIDAGPKGSGVKLKEFLAEQHLDHLNYVVLSDFDAEHVGGFVTTQGNQSLLWKDSQCAHTDLFPREKVYEHALPAYKTKSADEWNRCVGNFEGRVKVTKGSGLGHTMDLGEGYSATIVAGNEFVAGQDNMSAKVHSEKAKSLAILVSNKDGFDLLIDGDLIGQKGGGEDAQLELAVGEYLKKNTIDVEVLRVGNHGAENTSNPAFIEAAKPEVAIISVGEDANLKQPRCKTYQTFFEKKVKHVLQTEKGKPDCPKPALTPSVAGGTIRLDVRGREYRLSSIRGGEAVSLSCALDGCATTATGAGEKAAAAGK